MGVLDPASEDELDQVLHEVGATSVADLPQVPVGSIGVGAVVATAPARTPVEREQPSVAAATDLVQLFRKHLDLLRVELDDPTMLVLLAAYLSSQFVLFAGPSGTGKSTAAKALQTFFAPSDSRAVIDGRRQLLGAEDIVGFYSPLGDRFVRGPELEKLLRLSRPGEGSASPSLLVEEINLSPPESYLNPLVHGYSGLSRKAVHWQLFDEENRNETIKEPSVLSFVPFMRLLGTINVDQTAPAPAPKVAARACVVLLEPVPTSDLEPVWDTLHAGGSLGAPEALGAPYAGDPLQVLGSTGARRDTTAAECLRIAGIVEKGLAAVEDWDPVADPLTTISRRQLAQMTLYTAWYDLLARGLKETGAVDSGEGGARIGAENSALHFLLPSMGPGGFADALQHLSDASAELTSTGDVEGLGGTLLNRVGRLQRVGEGELIARTLDYWDRLS